MGRPPFHDPHDFEIRQDEPHPARMYDYVLGGSDNFAADRALAEEMGEVLPGGLDFARALARRNRAFMVRAVRWLAHDAGVRQFLDIGAGIPTATNNTHDIAQAADPAARVVYVDNDPVVLAHAHARLHSTPEGACAYVHADIRHPAHIVAAAARTLDLDKPVGLLLIAVLHLLDDTDDPPGIVAQLIDALPAGSYVALSHFTADIHTTEMHHMTHIYTSVGEPMAMRTHTQITTLLNGLEPIDPGVVLIEDWRPDTPHDPLPLYGAVAKKGR